jgi:hypothetical protein
MRSRRRRARHSWWSWRTWSESRGAKKRKPPNNKLTNVKSSLCATRWCVCSYIMQLGAFDPAEEVYHLTNMFPGQS